MTDFNSYSNSMKNNEYDQVVIREDEKISNRELFSTDKLKNLLSMSDDSIDRLINRNIIASDRYDSIH
jgi:hypothetical protein